MGSAVTFASLSRRARAALGLAGVLALAGCFAAIRAATASRGFDHAAHQKRDLDCTDCHEQAKAQAKAGMPKVDTCLGCHDAKEDKPTTTQALEATRTLLAAGPWPSAAVRGPTYGDVRFDHGKHAKGKVDCATCHTGAKSGALAHPDGPLAMDTCTRCHDERGAATSCDTCHEKRAKDWKPATHDPAWQLRHGLVSRTADRGQMAERCDLCHTRGDCDSCHERNAPRDHVQSWRVATHGLAASMDRSRCLACHQADSCERCHQNQPPRSHRNGWGGTREAHCLNCHAPLAGESCATCHKGTPSHEVARSLTPADQRHASALSPGECTSCHRTGFHPVNGDDCRSCH